MDGGMAMLNPKYQRYADRLRELINKSEDIAANTISNIFSNGVIADKIQLNSWLANVEHILEITFGRGSSYFRRFEESTRLKTVYLFQLEPIVGVLKGALNDLKDGFLLGQELLVASEVFDSLLEQAKYLSESGNKDLAAMLARVVIENALRRIARQEKIDDTQRVAKINDDFKKADRYSEPMRSQIQAWLAIGNSAAHGDFNDYDEKQVKSMTEGIRGFLAQELQI
jgi:hypothetical protein